MDTDLRHRLETVPMSGGIVARFWSVARAAGILTDHSREGLTMENFQRISRRRFNAALGAAVVGGPLLATRGASAGEVSVAPSERITVGLIGVGKMANDYHLKTLLGFPDVQIVAVCDVDTQRRRHARQRVEDAYSVNSGYRGCSDYRDFRELLDRKDIDGVVIATPDHWHAIAIIEACKAGKDVYCEKPLTLTLAESQRCMEAVRKHGRILQTGSQQRSSVFGPFRLACELVRSGRLGRIERVTVGVGEAAKPCDLPAEELEPGLDWDFWLGSAPERPYHSDLSPRGVHDHFPSWRSYIEYGGGGLSDMGAHHFDIAQWALDMDDSGPVRIIPPADPQAMFGAKFIYGNGVEMEHVRKPGGCVFYGQRGRLHIGRDILVSEPEEIAEEPLGEGDVRLPESPGHHRDWLDCIRSRKQPLCPVTVGARSAAICQLGALVYQHRRELAWDPQRWRFTDNSAPAKWLDRPRSDAWPLPRA